MPHGKSPTHTRKAKKKRDAPARSGAKSASKATAKPHGGARAARDGGESSDSGTPGASIRLQKLLASAGFGGDKGPPAAATLDAATIIIQQN